MGDNPYKFTTEEGEIAEPGQENINLFITNTLETLTFLLTESSKSQQETNKILIKLTKDVNDIKKGARSESVPEQGMEMGQLLLKLKKRDDEIELLRKTIQDNISSVSTSLSSTSRPSILSTSSTSAISSISSISSTGVDTIEYGIVQDGLVVADRIYDNKLHKSKDKLTTEDINDVAVFHSGATKANELLDNSIKILTESYNSFLRMTPTLNSKSITFFFINFMLQFLRFILFFFICNHYRTMNIAYSVIDIFVPQVLLIPPIPFINPNMFFKAINTLCSPLYIILEFFIYVFLIQFIFEVFDYEINIITPCTVLLLTILRTFKDRLIYISETDVSTRVVNAGKRVLFKTFNEIIESEMFVDAMGNMTELQANITVALNDIAIKAGEKIAGEILIVTKQAIGHIAHISYDMASRELISDTVIDLAQKTLADMISDPILQQQSLQLASQTIMGLVSIPEVQQGAIDMAISTVDGLLVNSETQQAVLSYTKNTVVGLLQSPEVINAGALAASTAASSALSSAIPISGLIGSTFSSFLTGKKSKEVLSLPGTFGGKNRTKRRRSIRNKTKRNRTKRNRTKRRRTKRKCINR